MLRACLRRYGLWPTVALLTLLAIAVSAGIASSMTYGVLDGTMTRSAWIITLLTPALIAPVMSGITLRLLQQLDRAHTELHEVIHRDHLTELHNRRYFMQMLHEEVERTRREDTAFALAIVDVDDFKSINDRFGHLGGDEVLRQIAQTCRAAVRESDVVARIGGEEFACLFRASKLDAAEQLAQHLLQRIRDLKLQFQGVPLAISVSIGLTGVHGPQADLGSALRLADNALYAAKSAGKNRLEIHAAQAA
uniref:GGDEF domain-containing protein n=1 Tax=mine drainage metagenome TaxID=410659 RepID=E6PRB3_9ZZZZ